MSEQKASNENWRTMLATYQRSDLGRSVWQIIDSFGPYFLLLILMYISLDYSYWITLALAVPAAGFQVRTFIIFHDCTHGSFFKSQRANDIMGTLSGLLTLTPYYEWRHSHSIHHATGSDLDFRGTGDVWMLTVEEYLKLPWHKKVMYRIYRNPFAMFFVGPLAMFFISHRFPSKNSGPRERRSVHLTTVAVVVITAAMSYAVGFWEFVSVMLPTIWIAGVFGIWLFYVQHQFDETYWTDHTNWDFFSSALKGSSFYKLPKVLQFFSGNIGFHHIHHLNPKIPNYKLNRVQNEVPMFQEVKPVTFFSSFRFLTLHLWNEKEQRLIGFRTLRRMRKSA